MPQMPQSLMNSGIVEAMTTRWEELAGALMVAVVVCTFVAVEAFRSR